MVQLQARNFPYFSTLPTDLDPRIIEILQRCLVKDARNRCHGIADVRIDIQTILADPNGVFAQPVATNEFLPVLPSNKRRSDFSHRIGGSLLEKLLNADGKGFRGISMDCGERAKVARPCQIFSFHQRAAGRPSIILMAPPESFWEQDTKKSATNL